MKYDQVVVSFIDGVLNCVAQPPCWQAQLEDGVLLILIWEVEIIQYHKVPNGVLVCLDHL